MTEQEVKYKILHAEGLKDFIEIIDLIGAEDLGDCYHPMSISQWYALVNLNKYPKYNTFEIPKKSGGTRLISTPKFPSYLLALKYTNKILQYFYEPPVCTMGFVTGKSVVSNAIQHINKKYILNIDLKDFFSSIYKETVIDALCERYKFPLKIAKIIAGLCCINAYTEQIITCTAPSHLPQGAPTSPVLSNMVCLHMDLQLSKLADRYKITYTRYADDITFSSNTHFRTKRFMKEIYETIKGNNLFINERKSRYQKMDIERQEVTGLIISREKINVPRSYVREIRELLYIWENYGRESAQQSQQRFSSKSGRINTTSNIENVIRGKLNYLKMIKGDKDIVYLKLKSKFDCLITNR